MASDIEFVNFVMDQIRDAGVITHKKMFGEYMIYSNQKPVLLVCDNTVFVKIHDCVKALLKDAETGFPYDGAKEHYIADVDDGELLSQIVREMERVTPTLKKKKKKS